MCVSTVDWADALPAGKTSANAAATSIMDRRRVGDPSNLPSRFAILAPIACPPRLHLVGEFDYGAERRHAAATWQAGGRHLGSLRALPLPDSGNAACASTPRQWFSLS